MNKLKADLVRAQAGAALGPSEKELYFKVLPDIEKNSTQEFAANFDATIQNIVNLDKYADDIRAGIAVLRPAPTQPGEAIPMMQDLLFGTLPDEGTVASTPKGIGPYNLTEVQNIRDQLDKALGGRKMANRLEAAQRFLIENNFAAGFEQANELIDLFGVLEQVEQQLQRKGK